MIALWLGHERTETTQGVHADLGIKEQHSGTNRSRQSPKRALPATRPVAELP